MNKKAFVVLTTAAMSLGVLQANIPVKQTDLKIGTVNINELISKSEEGKIAINEVEARFKELTEGFQKAQQNFAQEMSDFRAKAPTMSAQAREKEETRLMKAQREIESMAQTSEDEVKIMQQKKSETLFAHAQKIINEYGKANNYDLIIDIASGRVVYNRADKTDVTNQVLANMNKEYKTPTVAAAQKPTQATARASQKKPATVA